MLERGSVLTVALGGASGRKPRPAIAVQSSDLDFPDTLVVVPLTRSQSGAPNLKPVFVPDATNGLMEPSSLMVQRINSVRKCDIGKVVGTMSAQDMERVDLALALLLGLDRT